MNPHAALLLVRPRPASAAIARLQVFASGATTLLACAVAMLAFAFCRVASEEAGYRILAVALVGVLVVPLVTLGSATARLAARSRDDRIATLRLLGAPAAQVRRIAVLEVTLVAAIGVGAGLALHFGLPVAFGVLSIHGEPVAPEDLRLPWRLSAAIPPALVLVAALSAMLGLRRVVLTPLEVRTRARAPRLGWVRAVGAVGVVGVGILVLQFVSPSWGTVVVVAVLAAVVVAVMGVFGLVGPFAVSLIARLVAARTADPTRLVAARAVQDDPRAAWRSVSVLALASFVLVPAVSLLGYLEVIAGSASRELMTADQLLLFGDARTILIALVAISFVLVTCQVAITQTAAILERRDLAVALDRIGMHARELHRTRRLQVMMPALVAVHGGALTGLALAFPLVAVAVLTSPLSIVGIAGVLGGGVLLVRLGVSATGAVLRRIVAGTGRGE